MLAVPPSSALSAHPVRGELDAADSLPSVLKSAWAELASDAAEPSCFLEPWFALTALARLRGVDDVRVLSIWAGNCLLGVIPLRVAQRYGRIPMRHTVNWQSVQSFYGAPLIRAGWGDAFWDATLATLDEARWAPSFLSVSGLAEGGAALQELCAAASRQARPCPIVHRQERALLSSTLDAEAYLDQAVRGKKRKELRRLRNRLTELGEVQVRTLAAHEPIAPWLADFLALEAAGWKGSDGAAFANTPASAAFFDTMMHGAHAAGVLDFQRLDLDGRAIAMLINFVRPPGSFSFKIAYDEQLARFSPGVLIELENLKAVLANPALEWMDSCAAANHPMINSLWMERRSIVQVTIPLRGARRRTLFTLCRSLERASAALREWRDR